MTKNEGIIMTRYSRQELFTPIGKKGQEQISQSKIAIVGMGALGTVLANHMVRAGAGFVRIIDRDFVEMSNLQRQMLYDEQDALNSAPKAIAAAKRLKDINGLVTVEPHVTDLNPSNAEALLSDVDLILDGTDNFSVRFLINDVSIKHNIPWIYGGAVSSRGVSMTIIPEITPCLRCMFGQPPAQGTTETCDTSGVIGSIIHVVASYQAVEALKILVGDTAHLHHKMMNFDLWYNQHTSIDISSARKEDCPACSLHQYEYLEYDLQGDSIQSLCGRNSVQIHPVQAAAINLEVQANRLKPLGQVELNPFLLKFHIDQERCMILFPDGRAIIQGTDDLVAAKSLYSRFVGM
jgi:molybdopterin/thiamine biosynthesis adenylyltransferase